jgi:thiol-disulfide isomerase/thioredoxin
VHDRDGNAGPPVGHCGGVRTVGPLVLLAVLAAATLFGLHRRRVDGRLGRRAGLPRLTPADLGAPLGSRATLVHFSTAFCQPCRGVRRLLGDVAGMVDGVAHVEVDAESRLDLVRRLDIVRTPTVLVLDAEGRIVRRATGLPRKADVIAALGELV